MTMHARQQAKPERMSEEAKCAGAGLGSRWLVSGRVQRVGFRAATRREANRLGLRGHARNLPDGRVEVVAAGAPEAVREMREWLNRGPTLARVDGVEDGGRCEVPEGPFGTA